RISRFVFSQFVLNVAFGLVLAIGLFVIGIPYAFVWGSLAALLRYVPYLGPWIAASFPLLVSLAVMPGWTPFFLVVGFFVGLELIQSNVVEPLVFGHSIGVSGVALLIAALFWTWLWGPIGLILSTPLTLCLVILGRHVQRLEFLDVILGDRPALTPVENFYQRMLANDPDEALDQAELLLKERSLTAYYDEIALKGLQLAANDAQRGVLNADQLERIKNGMRELVRDLADHDDRDPSPEEEAEAAEIASQAEREIAKPSSPAAAVEQLAPAWPTEAA